MSNYPAIQQAICNNMFGIRTVKSSILALVVVCFLFTHLSTADACGVWWAYDEEYKFSLRFGCGYPNGVTAYAGHLGEPDIATVFSFGPYAVTKLVCVEDEIIYFKNEPVGQMSRDEFSIGDQLFMVKTVPLTDWSCSEEKEEIQIWEKGEMVVRVTPNPHCMQGNLIDFVEYLVLRHDYLSKVGERYRSNAGDFDIEKLKMGMKKNDVGASIVLSEHKDGLKILREILMETPKKSNVIRLVYHALEKMGEQARLAAPEILTSMNFKSKFARQKLQIKGVTTLAHMKAVDTIPEIIALTKVENKSLVEAATRALRIMGRPVPEVIQTLIQLLDNPFYSIRREAIVALGHFGSNARPALPKLKTLLEKNKRHGFETARAIEKIEHSASVVDTDR